MTTNKTFRSFCIAWVVQFVGTLLLLWVSYSWLTWPDERSWQVGASLAVAVFAMIALLWMERVVFAVFHHGIESPMRPRVSVLAALAVWVVVFACLELLVKDFYSNVERLAVRIAQMMHLSPRAVTATMDWGTWGVIWVIIPAVLMPLGSLAAREGFAAFRVSRVRVAFSLLLTVRYWVVLLIALFGGAYLPYRLIHWIPNRDSLRGEIWSAGLRLSAAYALAVTAFVFLAWGIARVFPADETEKEASR